MKEKRDKIEKRQKGKRQEKEKTEKGGGQKKHVNNLWIFQSWVHSFAKLEKTHKFKDKKSCHSTPRLKLT